MLTELALSTVTEAIFGYLLEKVDPVQWTIDWTTQQLGGEPDPKRRAFQQALATASRQLEIKHAQWVAGLFDSSFFHHEAAPILAQFLLRNGNPHPQQLAKIWVNSLGLTDQEHRQQLVTEIEPVAADFLHDLGNALKGEPALAEINDSRALERMLAELTVIRSHLQSAYQQPDLAAARTVYLDWLIDRNLYLDPRGTFQTQRQVQLKLDEVYISLRAQVDENPNFTDRRFPGQELAALAGQVALLTAEEQEDRYEQLYANLGYHQTALNTSSPPIELTEVVQRHDKLVILGDPGSGKTTLLRYLALQQASYLRYGRLLKDTEGQSSTLDRKFSHFPIFIRIADYAEDGAWKRYALSDFLPAGLALLECNPPGLADLLLQELNQGGCLVLLDGLDEIVEADHRRNVVQRIEDFVRRYDQGGLRGMNRFIVSSRIAGYRSTPLTGIGGKAFAHYVVQEMDDDQIKRFLERWCRAVEDSQTPDLAERTRQATAQREIDGILAAVQKTPGVRRLAANPLMLRVLALIHRTGARLPQKRIELYKLATDTLAHTWRPAQGIPASALVEDRYLTPLLSKLAYWMHLHKDAAIATEREVYEVLGAEWARIRRLDQETQWEEIQGEVQKFLTAVREHTGLFVERAPKRYGFMHLTFEEYYAARHLVVRRRDTAKLIRQHLHDPRWEEPILLALGFVGLDYPDEAAELVETAILAQGEEADALGFQPSRYEDLLGRDYLFALRCLGDQIPVDVMVMQQLIDRLAGEILYHHGSARFDRYEQEIQERLAYMLGSSGANLLIKQLLASLRQQDIPLKVRAIKNLIQLKHISPELVTVTLDMLKNEDWKVRAGAAGALRNIIEKLNEQDPASTNALIGLQTGIYDTEAIVRWKAANQLKELGHVSPEVVETLEALLYVEDTACRLAAASDLKDLAKGSSEIIQRLYLTLLAEDKMARSLAALILGEHGEKSSEVIDALLDSLHILDDIRLVAAKQLGILGQNSPQALQGLLTKATDDESSVRYAALAGLHFLNLALPEVIQTFLDALDDNDEEIRHFAVAALHHLIQTSPEIIDTLKEIAQDKNKYAQAVVLLLLNVFGHLPLTEINIFDLLKFQDLYIQAAAAARLSSENQQRDNSLEELLDILHHEEQDTQIHAAIILGIWGQRLPEIKNQLLMALNSNEIGLQSYVAERLIKMDWLLPEAITALQEVIKHTSNDEVRADAIALLGQRGQPEEAILKLLQPFLFYSNDLDKVRVDKLYVADSCREAFIHLGKRYPNSIPTIEGLLIETIHDPTFAQNENAGLGKNQAYKALWQLVIK